MPKSHPSEDSLLQFCYEADIGRGSYEEQIKRVKWNYEARFDKPPKESLPRAVCEPFGDHGYIEPFLDFSLYKAPAKANTERVFIVPSKRSSLFTRYFKAGITSSTYVRCFGGGHPCSGVGSIVTADKAKPDNSWLFSIIDTALLELEDLLEEANLYLQLNPSVELTDDAASEEEEEDMAAYEVVLSSLKARMTDDEFFGFSQVKLGNLSAEVDDDKDDDKIYIDYDHLPWPWISLPPSNELPAGITFRRDKLDESELGHEDEEMCLEIEEEDELDGSECSCHSSLPFPLHQSSPVSKHSPPSRYFLDEDDEDGNDLSPSRALRSIPVLSPLGVHRAEGGERIIGGGGVDHRNLIQLVGNPAHELQPKLVQSWRNPNYIQWLNRWDSLSLDANLNLSRQT